MSSVRILLCSMLLVLLAVPANAQEPPAADQDPELNEWEVPYPESRPRDPYVGPDGRVWFVGQRSHYAAVLDPATGDFRRYALDDGVGPHNLIVDGDGTVYYAGNRATHIGRLDPETGDIEKVMMPDERARDPHTLVWDHDGNIWFTVQGGNFVGHMNKSTGEVRLAEGPEVEGSRRGNSSRPYGIKIDSENRPWIALFNTNLIATVDPATMEMHTFELPEGARPRRLVLTSDDQVWYVDYSRGMLGHVDPDQGFVEEFANPSGEESRPYGVAIDKDDRIWLVETGVQPNRFVGFDPVTKEFFSEVEVASGGGTIRHMFYDLERNAIWFGTDANTVGRAVLPPVRRPVS